MALLANSVTHVPTIDRTNGAGVRLQVPGMTDQEHHRMVLDAIDRLAAAREAQLWSA